MPISRRSTFVVAAAMLLAGCASPQPEATEPAPSESTPAAASAPSFRFGLTCADILDVAEVQAQISQPVSVKIDETSTLSNWYDVNLAQVGGIHCAWGGDAKTDQRWDYGYELWIRPDALSLFTTWLDGDQSSLEPNNCFGDTTFPCTANYSFGDTWVHAYMSDDSPDTSVSALAFSALNNEVDERLTDLALADPWPAPASAIDVCAEPAASERVSQATERDAETLVPPQFAPQLDISTSGADQTCGWYDAETGNNVFVVEQIPGGGWAFDAMATDAPHPFLIERMAAVPVAGADVAYFGCGDGCAALVKVGDDLIQIDTGAYDQDQFIQVVTAWVGGL
jgi:hypothetical protein